MIALEKTRWSRQLVEAIHNISFQTKEAWANIKLLCKGENIHHSSPKTIHMRMVSGELATTNEENVWVLPGHFRKVLNDMKPIDTSVINGLFLRKAIQELDLPPEWVEFIIEVVEPTNNKAPRLNDVPPNAFKAMTENKLLHLVALCTYRTTIALVKIDHQFAIECSCTLSSYRKPDCGR